MKEMSVAARHFHWNN